VIIAIDGPSVSGKTTVGKLLAHKLGYLFVDTGIIYRVLAYISLRQGKDEKSLIAISRNSQFEFLPPDGISIDSQRFYSSDLYSSEVEKLVPHISQIARLREAVLPHQRRLAGENAVMAGRDIGTVVFPSAELKIYLEAGLEERAQRRSLQKGENPAAALDEIRARDDIDKTRSVSPLRPAADSHIIDTEGITPAEVVHRILKLAEEKCGFTVP
jgi:cytidylate kinase